MVRSRSPKPLANTLTESGVACGFGETIGMAVYVDRPEAAAALAAPNPSAPEIDANNATSARDRPAVGMPVLGVVISVARFDKNVSVRTCVPSSPGRCAAHRPEE